MNHRRFYSHGKLLITGEYLVLDGAKALAIPCQYGQSLEVERSSEYSTWLSYDDRKQIWLETEFNILEVIENKLKGKNEIEKRLFQILKEANQLNPDVFTQNYKFKTHLEFPKNWGLGTSSTLIANVAKWANVNPYTLLANTFGGSGYDIACANSDSALVYQIENKTPKVEPAHIPEFLKPNLYFIHLGEKQNSREAIANYKAIKPTDLDSLLSKVNSITSEFQKVDSLKKAQELLENHEELLSKILKVDTVKNRLFSDFKGSIKSLGAWGGDFIMAVSEEDPSAYFKSKGFKTILTYNNMSL